MLAASLGQSVALSQSLRPSTVSSVSTSPARVREWASRLQASDPKVRASAEAALVQGAPRSLPLLRRLLTPEHEDLYLVTFEVIRRIGPPAIPLLADLLRNDVDAIRRHAADTLIDLAPHTEGIQPSLRRALRDEDAMVAGDAARALGALGRRATPSVGALVRTLSHEDGYVRVYAAEALASIGPNAAAATGALADALGDPVPGVRWAACEALARIGPAAQPAVPRLIEALEDEFLYVRIFAAGALGSIGPKARPARAALEAAAEDPALRHEAEWALGRIAGGTSVEPVASPVAPAPSVAPVPATAPPVPTGIRRSTGTRPPAATSPGASSWGTRRSAVRSSPAMPFTSAPTTPGTWTRRIKTRPACSWRFTRRMGDFSGRTWRRASSEACASSSCRR